MSAWPQAVWIVRKVQNHFNFDEKLRNYANSLNELNDRINNLNDLIEGYKLITLRKQSVENVENPQKGTICLIIQQ